MLQLKITALSILTTKLYWLFIALAGCMMEAVALYYQYVLGEEPCQICIHIRIWVAAFTLLSVIMCLLPRSTVLHLMGHGLALFCMIGLFERSKYLFEVENGRGDGSCEFFLGFPEWFALDKWFPFIFEVRNLCTFSPELIWGVTMTEGLLAASSVLILLTGSALLVNFQYAYNKFSDTDQR